MVGIRGVRDVHLYYAWSCCPVYAPNAFPGTQVLFLQLEHDIRNLNILFGRILASDLEDDILLMLRNRLLANCFDELAQSMTWLA